MNHYPMIDMVYYHVRSALKHNGRLIDHSVTVILTGQTTRSSRTSFWDAASTSFWSSSAPVVTLKRSGDQKKWQIHLQSTSSLADYR